MREGGQMSRPFRKNYIATDVPIVPTGKKSFVGELLAAGFAGARTVFSTKNSALFAASHAGRRGTSHRIFRMPICVRINLVTN